MKLTQLQLLLKLKNYSIRNKKKFVVKKTEKILLFVEFLYEEKLLQSFSIHNEEIHVALRSHNDVVLLRELKIISSSSFHKFLTYEELCKLQFSNKTVIGISTDCSIRNLSFCKTEKKGGKILFTS